MTGKHQVHFSKFIIIVKVIRMYVCHFQVGLVEVLCFRTQWKGFVKDEIIDEHQKPIFKVIASAVSCCQKDDPIKVSLTNSEKNKRGWDYKVVGSFTERDCGIYDHSGAIAAEVGPLSFSCFLLIIQINDPNIEWFAGVCEYCIYGFEGHIQRCSGSRS